MNTKNMTMNSEASAPVSFKPKAELPTAVLSDEVVVFANAPAPKALLLSPVVMSVPAL